jgi:hypothetical protein
MSIVTIVTIFKTEHIEDRSVNQQIDGMFPGYSGSF